MNPGVDMLNRNNAPVLSQTSALLLVALFVLTAARLTAAAQSARSSTGNSLAYLQKHVGQEPYNLWKTQPLQRRLMALLGPEYKNLIANLDPASELEEQNDVLHTEGNAPHRGGE